MAETEISDANESKSRLHLPFTFRGVASLAQGSGFRVGVVMIAVALFIAVCCVWFINRHWIPSIEEAISNLPDSSAAIHDGQLNWPDAHPVELSNLKHAAFPRIIVDPYNHAEYGREADFQIELREKQWVFSSVFGYIALSYPKSMHLALSRKKLDPWWGARKPFLLLGVGMATILWLALVWPLAALVGVWPVRTVAYFADREGQLGVQWKLSLSSLMPGAMLFAIGIICYGLGLLPLMGLMIVFVLHLVVGWVFMFFSLFHLPRLNSAQYRGNPFDSENKPSETRAEDPFSSEVRASKAFLEDDEN